LLSIERKHRVMARRAGVFQELERAIERGFYDNAEDAAERARSRHARAESASGEAA
jgi:DNA sulfur modification protein DndC